MLNGSQKVPGKCGARGWDTLTLSFAAGRSARALSGVLSAVRFLRGLFPD